MKDLTVGKEGKQILMFALPMLFGNLFQQLYNIVDSIIVGRVLGKAALAAVGASFPIIFTLISLVIGIGMGGAIIISQYFGAKNYHKVKKTIDTLLIFLFFAGLLVSVLGIPFTDEIFRLLKLPEDIMPQANTYLKIYLSGMLAFFGFNGTSSILRGLGDSKTPLYFLMLSTVFNIGLDLLFIVVFGWGIEGAAIATILSQGGAFVTAVVYLNKTHKIIQFSFTNLVFDKSIFRDCIRIGLPSGLQHTFIALGMMALMGIVNTFGTDVVAGYSAAMRIDSLAILPAMNFSAALSTFVGQNLGAQKLQRIKAGFRATFYMSSSIAVFITLIVVLFGESFMTMFTTDQNVINIGHEYLVIISTFYILFSVMFLTHGVLRGAGDTLVPMFISLLSLWIIRLPLAYVLSKEVVVSLQVFGNAHRLALPGNMGETGIWWSAPISWMFGLALSYLYYLKGNWKKKGVVKAG